MAIAADRVRSAKFLQVPLVLLTALALIAALLPSLAAATTSTKVVSYHGYKLTIPKSWPVYRISAGSKTCVRFNRHALYLGRPGTDQQCPSQVAGRTDAILAQPESGSSATSTGAADLTGSVERITNSAHKLVITLTWRPGQGASLRRALGLSKLSASKVDPKASTTASKVAADPAVRSFASTASTTATPGEVYSGLGFDSCATPSSALMNAWSSSSYRAVGVYIGGANMACAQTNLTTSWVTKQSDAGWHIVPIYVGLQAPSNACGCQSITVGKAASQGDTAAAAAVQEAKSIGLGTGNPIYYDMEGYNTTVSGNSTAVLNFLQAWTETLHKDGYRSGVYSSADSGISDLASKFGSGYTEPDDIWFADWNDEQNVTSSVAPTSEWADGKRMHQYKGDTTVTEGGDTLSVDDDWLDSQTAAAGSSSVGTTDPAPSASTAPTVYGTPVAGQVLTDEHGSWTGSPTSYSYQWQLCNASGATCANISAATARTYTVPSKEAGDTIRVEEKAKNTAGTGTAKASAVTAKVAAAATGFWQYTGFGNVYNTLYEPFYGSAPASHMTVSNIIGLARTSDSEGYWMATSSGQVYGYGDAAKEAAVKPVNPVVGIAANPDGKGYWLVTAHGNVYNAGISFHGSPAASRIAVSNVVGIAATTDGKGYWLVTSSGKVYAYGNAAKEPAVKPANAVTGIVTNPAGKGYWLITAHGNIYNAGSSWYGSPAGSRISITNVAGLAPTSTGKGYWLVTSAGKIYPYGNATAYTAPEVGHPVIGVVAGP
jgi:Domain of unknown function (DUF1906)